MRYKVINFFTDLQDNDHPYNPGDEYPREGAATSKGRIKELSGNDNRQGKPLIEMYETVEEPPEDFMPYPENTIENQVEEAAKEEKPKRSRKKKADAE